MSACQWFAGCGRPATGTTPHPILGDVPTCDRCNTFAEGLPREAPRGPSPPSKCEQRGCIRDAAVYAMGPGAGDWGGYYCEPCARALGFQITDRL